jgi:hypothetical protein
MKSWNSFVVTRIFLSSVMNVQSIRWNLFKGIFNYYKYKFCGFVPLAEEQTGKYPTNKRKSSLVACSEIRKHTAPWKNSNPENQRICEKKRTELSFFKKIEYTFLVMNGKNLSIQQATVHKTPIRIHTTSQWCCINTARLVVGLWWGCRGVVVGLWWGVCGFASSKRKVKTKRNKKRLSPNRIGCHTISQKWNATHLRKIGMPSLTKLECHTLVQDWCQTHSRNRNATHHQKIGTARLESTHPHKIGMPRSFVRLGSTLTTFACPHPQGPHIFTRLESYAPSIHAPSDWPHPHKTGIYTHKIEMPHTNKRNWNPHSQNSNAIHARDWNPHPHKIGMPHPHEIGIHRMPRNLTRLESTHSHKIGMHTLTRLQSTHLTKLEIRSLSQIGTLTRLESTLHKTGIHTPHKIGIPHTLTILSQDWNPHTPTRLESTKLECHHPPSRNENATTHPHTIETLTHTTQDWATPRKIPTTLTKIHTTVFS